MRKNKYALRIVNLSSHHQSEKDGDEVFLKFREKKIWPIRDKYLHMNGESIAKVNQTIEILPGSMVEIELWEHDFFINEKLGDFKMIVNEIGGPFYCDMQMASRTYSRYTVTWEVSTVLQA